MLDLSNHRQSIQVVLDKHSQKAKSEYRIHLEASIDVDIVNAYAKETLKVIIEDLNGDYFGILVDESKEISHKEQMALILSLVHVSDTLAYSLKKEIYSLLFDHSQSPSKIRGQGYDGASNMKGEINVEDFFDHVTNVLNVNGGFFKRRDLLRHHQAINLKQLFESGKAHTGQGLHQECGLQRSGDTRWGSHFKTLDNFLVIFSFVIHGLEVIEIEGSTSSDRNQVEYLLTKVKTFKFIFILHLMLKVLAMSNELSKILPKKVQDIVNDMEFLNISKKRLQDMRENRWKSLLDDVSSFCDSHGILIPKLDEPYFPGKSKLKCLDVCYSHHLRVEIFCAVIDVQLQELNNHFDVVSSDLLLGMGSLNPVNSFFNFDKDRIMTLAKCYPNEFDDGKLQDLSYQLDTFIIYMRSGNFKFSNLQGIRVLAKALVEANLVETYSLIYLLVKLALILPVATATVERALSSMKHIKNEVRNSIGDQYLNDCLVCYIERDVFANVSNDVIVDRFQNMKTHRGQL
ncbi:uncharacterized protein LOC124888971 [Capsicum annuum]|uniref:uncharacterized protein LOC124888971 n=1 Tax=Capsicum annuum TaxID=4072 RepID=UPI001FB1228E|nr:uncharacterized protein LOC124888971 [Capsicum annuum]